jgi:hypothetical protein
MSFLKKVISFLNPLKKSDNISETETHGSKTLANILNETNPVAKAVDVTRKIIDNAAKDSNKGTTDSTENIIIAANNLYGQSRDTVSLLFSDATTEEKLKSTTNLGTDMINAHSEILVDSITKTNNLLLPENLIPYKNTNNIIAQANNNIKSSATIIAQEFHPGNLPLGAIKIAESGINTIKSAQKIDNLEIDSNISIKLSTLGVEMQNEISSLTSKLSQIFSPHQNNNEKSGPSR